MRSTNLSPAAHRRYEEKDTLFLRIQTPVPSMLPALVALAQDIIKRHRGTGFEAAKTEAIGEEIWADRRQVYFNGFLLLPDSRAIGTDVCLPISKLPQFIMETKKDLEEHQIIGPIVGHVGDGESGAL